MLKVEIVMDEEKILRENKYSLEDIYATIDSAYLRKNLRKLDKGVYGDNGSEKDFANFGSIMLALEKCEWFMTNVKKWLWLNSHGSDSEDDFVAEDIISELVDA